MTVTGLPVLFYMIRSGEQGVAKEACSVVVYCRRQTPER